MEVDVGDIAYWPEGKCICVFFGPTPVSQSGKPVPASPVVIIGKAMAKPDEFRRIQTGHPVRVMTVEEKPVPVSYSMSCEPERKLTQSEIDKLVQQLLAERSKRPPAAQ